MSNFTVYDVNGKTQVMDRPYDVILLKKSHLDFDDLDIYSTANGQTWRRAMHYRPPTTERIISAWRPRSEPEYANKVHYYTPMYRDSDGNLFQEVRFNPMSLYYYSLDFNTELYKKNYGMEVFDDQGNITWASYHTSMNVVDTISVEDVRYSNENLWDLYNRNFGHTNIAVIPVANPTFQSGRDFLWFRWCFDEYGALRVRLAVETTLTSEEVSMGAFHAYPTYRLEFIVIDVSNATNFVNDPSVLVGQK